MNKKGYKYSTEKSIVMFLNSYMFLQQKELDVFANRLSLTIQTHPSWRGFAIRGQVLFRKIYLKNV